MGCDDSWPVMAPNVVPSLWYSLSEKATRKHSNGRTIRPIANLMADSESGSLDSYSSSLVTIRLSRLVSEIFACDRQTDGQCEPLL